jgi:hypothetical protein
MSTGDSPQLSGFVAQKLDFYEKEWAFYLPHIWNMREVLVSCREKLKKN